MKTERVAAALAGALCCAIGLIAACSLNLPNPTDPVPPTTTTRPPAPPTSTTTPPWLKDVDLGRYQPVEVGGKICGLFFVRQFPSYPPNPKFGEERPALVWLKNGSNQVLCLAAASDAIGWISALPLSQLPASFWFCFKGRAGVSVYYVPDSSRDLYPLKPVLEVK